jgi:hypothetical protein
LGAVAPQTNKQTSVNICKNARNFRTYRTISIKLGSNITSLFVQYSTVRGYRLVDYGSIPGSTGISVLADPHKMGSTQPPVH